MPGKITEVTGGVGAGDWKYILFAALIFFLNHCFSYIYNKPRDTELQNISKLMFYPYLRIIPMHLTIIIGVFTSGGLLIFLILKMMADGIMHVFEHRGKRRSEAT